MDLFKKLINSFFVEKEKIKLNISNNDKEIKMFSDNLTQFSSIEKQLELGIQDLDTIELKKVLKDLKITSVSEADIDTFEELKKIFHYLYDPRLPNVGIKHAQVRFLNEFSDKLRNVGKELNDKLEQLKKQLSQYKFLDEKIDYYTGIIGVEKFYLRLSVEELNDLFDFLELLAIDRKLILDIVAEIAISKLKYSEQLHKEVSLEVLPSVEEIEKEVDKNADRLLGKDNKDDKKEENVDLSFLSEEERQLILELQALFLENDTEGAKFIFDIVRDEIGHLDLDERKTIYFRDGLLEWDVIFADYHTNLLPNISTHKDEVLVIIKYIINADKAIKEEKIIETEEFREQIIKFKTISAEAKEMLGVFYSNPFEFCLDLSNEDVETVYAFFDEISMLIDDNYEKVENDNISDNDLKMVNLKLGQLIFGIQEIIKRKEHVNDSENVSGYKLETTKTIILFLKDKDENVVPIKEIENEEHKDISDIKMDELQKSIVMISERGMFDNKKKFRSSHVDKRGSNGKDILLKDYFGFDVDRIRFGNHGRTGYVVIPVHEENRKKLMSLYGNNIFSQNYNSIILIVASICCFADHNEYDIFKELIDENKTYLTYVLELFNNPNASLEEMVLIIEDSAKECKNICSCYGRGGK